MTTWEPTRKPHLPKEASGGRNRIAGYICAIRPHRIRNRNLIAEAELMEQVTPDSALKSSFYEQLVEHVFISELLQEAWYRYGQTVEVLRSEVDASGYDLVLECNGILRHVQLKTSAVDAKARFQKVNIKLAEKPSGCVVWLSREENADTCRMSLRYRFFGGAAGTPLPLLDTFKVARHTKADSTGAKRERPAIREVPKARFETLNGIEMLLFRLFGLSPAPVLDTPGVGAGIEAPVPTFSGLHT